MTKTLRPWALALALVTALAMAAIASWSSGPPAQAQDPTPNACEDLTISKEPFAEAEGDQLIFDISITYVIMIENEGDEPCENVEIVERIPDGSACVRTRVLDDLSDVRIETAKGCDGAGDVTWEVIDDLEPDQQAQVQMTVELDRTTKKGPDIDNIACVLSDGEEEACDELSVDVVEALQPEPTETAPPPPTTQPVDMVPPKPTIAPPATGTGPGGGSSTSPAIGAGLLGLMLLLASSALLAKRTR